MTDRPLSPHTIAAQAGGFLDATTGAVTPAIQPSTTFARGTDNELIDPNNIYSRHGSDVSRLAESLLAQFENAQDAMLFPSGMAAIAALIRAMPVGATVLVQSQIYWGTTHWTRQFAMRQGLNLIEADLSDPTKLEALCEDRKPDLVFIETPSNPWLRITDIAHAAKVTHAVGGLLAVDGTAATPICTRALDFGADFVMHSATKAINGHSDVLAGVLATNDPEGEIWEIIAEDRSTAGAVIGTFEAWLLVRGMRTLPLRVERMCASALTLAGYLESHPRVTQVMYPGLESHDGHGVAIQQMKGFGGLLSAVIDGGLEPALDVAGKLNLFHRATSLGGVESLVEHRHTIEPHTGIPEGLLRLSVGIEDVADLIADWEQALA